MPDQNISWWVKYRKDIFLTLVAITTVVVGVLGYDWADRAEKTFWSTFWTILAIACDLLFLGAWAYFYSKDKRK